MALRCHVLIGYMPVPKYQVFKKSSCPAARLQFFHDCMAIILWPLIKAGKHRKDMACCNGIIRRIYPILAIYVANAPKQARVCCTKENRCPKCLVSKSKRGDVLYPNHTGRVPLCDPIHTRGILSTVNQTGHITRSCRKEGLQPCCPFWALLPHTDIFAAITPDILHQLHIGLVGEHLFTWIFKAVKAAKIPTNKLDDQFAAIPKYPGLHCFCNGVLAVSQWTGKEHREMGCILIGCLIGLVDDRVIKASVALLDIVHFMCYRSHDDNTLDLLQDAIDRFHNNKAVFIDLKIRTHFNIPKLHALQHYVDSIQLFGTADGYNTEISERLHIDMAKKAYRASNRHDHTSQMATWLHRQEKMAYFKAYQLWFDKLGARLTPPAANNTLIASVLLAVSAATPLVPAQAIKAARTPIVVNGPHSRYSIPKAPSERKVSLQRLASVKDDGFHAVEFQGKLKQYLSDVSPPHYSYSRPHSLDKFNVYKQITFHLPTVPQISLMGTDHKEWLRAVPSIVSPNGRTATSAAFGIALVQVPNQHAATAGSPLQGELCSHYFFIIYTDTVSYTPGLQPARVQVIFDLPKRFCIPGYTDNQLIYVEWLTPLSRVNPTHGLQIVACTGHQAAEGAGDPAELSGPPRTLDPCVWRPSIQS
jgi:hypothetical protein